jgi:hypothetical protein
MHHLNKLITITTVYDYILYSLRLWQSFVYSFSRPRSILFNMMTAVIVTALAAALNSAPADAI